MITLGASFTYLAKPAAPKANPVSQPAAVRPNPVDIKVLVIEDDAALRHQFGEMLKAQGFQYKLAETLQEAVEAFNPEAKGNYYNPDAVIVDMGYEDYPDYITYRPEKRFVNTGTLLAEYVHNKYGISFHKLIPASMYESEWNTLDDWVSELVAFDPEAYHPGNFIHKRTLTTLGQPEAARDLKRLIMSAALGKDWEEEV